MTARVIGLTDITTAWSGPAFSQAPVRRSAPASGGAYNFMQADFDSNGNLIRTYDLASGRMDCYGVNSVGAAFVVAYSGAAADGNVLGHFAYRGQDANGTYDTFAYVEVTAVHVSASAGGLYSKMFLGVMNAQSAGAGNAQPNWGVTLDGSANAFTFSGQISINTGSGSMNIGAGGVTGVQMTSAGVATQLPTKIAQEQYVNKTTNYSIAASDAGTIFTNIGAAGEVDFTLPTGLGSGSKFTFVVNAAQTVKVIAPASTIIRVGPAVSAAAGNVASAQQGASIELIYFASSLSWIARNVTGTGGTTGAGGWTVT